MTCARHIVKPIPLLARRYRWSGILREGPASVCFPRCGRTAQRTDRILAERLARAAERGVRVRVLVDDANVQDRDAAVASFDAHPNIEVRLFNPFAQRKAKMLDFVTDFERVNHRMHNKLMVFDGAAAIVGGRNMSDPFFGVNATQSFRDLDVVAVGPIVRELSKVYDRFWNGDWAVPVAALTDRPYGMDD